MVEKARRVWFFHPSYETTVSEDTHIYNVISETPL